MIQLEKLRPRIDRLGMITLFLLIVNLRSCLVKLSYKALVKIRLLIYPQWRDPTRPWQAPHSACTTTPVCLVWLNAVASLTRSSKSSTVKTLYAGDLTLSLAT
jgi:hypothetical protein